ncbi:hypothetical protein ACFOWE_01845 [Planomonospora corallina]|uniref:Uncharacterized protein n=1 Tax=Planomonospora corallina TaxID=1806052 RepID=A0ABV8HYL2_9ACTN
MTGERLEDGIVQEGGFTDGLGAPVTVVNAGCKERDVDGDGVGVGVYRCIVGFADGERQIFAVTVRSSGRWVADAS